MIKKLPQELAEDIVAKIENESFDYWLRDGGWAFSQLKNYPELLDLAQKARDAMDALENALESAGVKQL